MDMDFCVIGGDMRQAKLGESLLRDGHRVTCFGLGRAGIDAGLRELESAAAAKEAGCVILPLPVSVDDINVNMPMETGTYNIDEMLGQLRAGQVICAGRVSPATAKLAEARGLKLHDYFAREELAVANAVPTAEGVIQLAMEELPITLHGAKVLIIGFGRTGKLLAHKMAALGARVSVAARRYEALAWIEAYGYKAEHTEQEGAWLGGYNLIVNTVPVKLLTESRLRELSPGCLCIDIASWPGSIDFDAAANLGLKVVWALSLPGKVAPETAGEIIKNTIYNILRELGE